MHSPVSGVPRAPPCRVDLAWLDQAEASRYSLAVLCWCCCTTRFSPRPVPRTAICIMSQKLCTHCIYQACQ